MKADLAMALHFHQPVGNFDHVMQRVCDDCYVPFLETLKKYPDLKMTLHFTGCLLEWAEANRPEIIEMVGAMAASGQVEMMGGGFYEPILISIPYRDRLAQVRMLSEYIKSRFACEPAGGWVAERIWEPDLPSVMHDAGIKYVILDDTHFLYAGVTKDRTYGYYTTEDNGKVVAVFPTDKMLRYQIPYKMPEECFEYMKGVACERENPVFVYGDDGEKFGEWPGTKQWVYGEKWLEKFFDGLMENAGWLRTVKLSDCLAARQPEGRVYLPTTSYEEMLEWALPVNSQLWMEEVVQDIRNADKEEWYKPFIRGGFWRNFLSKYPESNHMNKKMIYVSDKLEKFRRSGKADAAELAEAEKDLLRGQCNCAYWHGVFGGLYLFHLRRSLYHHAIKSEARMDEALYGKKPFCSAQVVDFDADGLSEIVLENRKVSLYLDPGEGGILKELDSKEVCQNLINSLARRKEAYHKVIIEKIEHPAEEGEEVKTIHDGIQVADEGVKDHLTYDWYDRYSLIDHFIGEDVYPEAFARCEYNEIGDFVKGVYDLDHAVSADGIQVTMKRTGLVDGASVSVSKEITLSRKDAGFSVKYLIENKEDRAINFTFGPEFNLTMPDADSDRYSLVTDGAKKGSKLGETAEADGIKLIEVLDSEKKLSFSMKLSEKARFWHFPVKTVSQSEKAYELNYQSSVLFPHFRCELGAGEKKSIDLEIGLAGEI